ncbi:unnamed protein product [Polarella glacialis]|uniref:Uncharacterized protein n=1 Tax=Polarella glacialis TaxID=89957 RepID=A0A813I4P2_POLGL|nr:unnamed protein product [Polarella glacialis]
MAALPSSIMEGQWCGTPTGEVTLDILFRLPLAGRRDFKVVRTTLSHATAMPTGKILLEVRLLLHVRISHFQRQENTGGLLSQQAVGAFFRQLILNGSKRFPFRTSVLRLISLFNWEDVLSDGVCCVSPPSGSSFSGGRCVVFRGVALCGSFLVLVFFLLFSSLLWVFVLVRVVFSLLVFVFPFLWLLFGFLLCFLSLVFCFCFCFLLVLLFCCFGFWFVLSFVWCWFCFVCPLLLSLVFCFGFGSVVPFCLSLFLSGLFGCCFCFVVLSLFVFVFGFVCPLWCPLSFVCVVFVAFPFCFCFGLSLVVFCWCCCSFVLVLPGSPCSLCFLLFSFFSCFFPCLFLLSVWFFFFFSPEPPPLSRLPLFLIFPVLILSLVDFICVVPELQ